MNTLVAAIQMQSLDDLTNNLQQAAQLLAQAAQN